MIFEYTHHPSLKKTMCKFGTVAKMQCLRATGNILVFFFCLASQYLASFGKRHCINFNRLLSLLFHMLMDNDNFHASSHYFQMWMNVMIIVVGVREHASTISVVMIVYALRGSH